MTDAGGAPEVWLRGPVPGYAPMLMPIAHALLQAREDVTRVAGGATAEELWQRPGGAASAGYHLQHLAGSLDRLFTYARGAQLDDAQRAALLQEGTPGGSVQTLVPTVLARIDQALEQLRHIPVETLEAAREVGRARLPSTVLGLLVHAAEHTSRHVGQLITTLKVVRGSNTAEPT
jgi:DinB family protein